MFLTTEINLKPDCLALTQNILATHAPVADVWAYGSRVNGDAHEASDLDLVVRNPEDLTRPQQNMAKLIGAFTESNLPILVDVFDWARLSDGFHERILACYEVVQQPVGVAKK